MILLLQDRFFHAIHQYHPWLFDHYSWICRKIFWCFPLQNGRSWRITPSSDILLSFKMGVVRLSKASIVRVFGHWLHIQVWIAISARLGHIRPRIFAPLARQHCIETLSTFNSSIHTKGSNHNHPRSVRPVVLQYVYNRESANLPGLTMRRGLP